MPFKRGQSGNPGGRPSDTALRELCRAKTAEAVKTLKEIMSNKKAPPAARISAACALLDRGYGRPSQVVTGAEGGPITVELVQFSSALSQKQP